MLPDAGSLSILIAGSAVILLYVIIILLLRWGLKSLIGSQSHRPEEPAAVGSPEEMTVIVPFRNESGHLEDLVSDLKAQTYPPERYRVILVDDHSEDDSFQLLQRVIQGDPRFTAIELGDDRTGKKEAIALAMKEVRTDLVIQTDADCRISTGFLKGHMAFLHENPCDLVAGLVTTQELEGGFSEAMDRIELLGLAGSGAGSFGLGRPVMCSGANLVYTRELYQETRAFDPGLVEKSGDDMFLMIGARKLGKRLGFCTDPETLVKTRPVRGIPALISQRIRWGSKSVRYRMADIQLLALIVALSNLLVLLLPVSTIWISHFWPVMIGVVFLKMLADFLMIYTVSGITGQRRTLRWFLPVTFVFHFLQPVIYARLFFRRSSWKGRS